MKKIIYLLSLFAFTSCSVSPLNIGNDLAEKNLRGPVATMTEIEVYFGIPSDRLSKVTKNDAASICYYYNSAGNLEAIEHLEDDYGTYFEYDETGKLIRDHSEDHRYGDDLMNINVYNYNEEGQLESIDRTVHATLSIKYKVPEQYLKERYFEYEKDSFGYQLVKEYSDGKLFKVEVKGVPAENTSDVLASLHNKYRYFEIYSPEGLLLVEYEVDFGVINTTHHKYNEDRVLIEKHTYKDYQSLMMGNDIINYNIDKKGNIVTKVDSNSTITHKYKYDSHGNWIEHEIINDPNDHSLTTYSLFKRIYTYHE